VSANYRAPSPGGTIESWSSADTRGNVAASHLAVLPMSRLSSVEPGSSRPTPCSPYAPQSPQNKWDTAPLVFRPNSLKTKETRPKKWDTFSTHDRPGFSPATHRASSAAPKKCHSVQPFATSKPLKINDPCAKEVSHFFKSRSRRPAPDFRPLPRFRRSPHVDKQVIGRLACPKRLTISVHATGGTQGVHHG
jgi:hypothetical protein